jgi:hypothetical protein
LHAASETRGRLELDRGLGHVVADFLECRKAVGQAAGYEQRLALPPRLDVPGQVERPVGAGLDPAVSIGREDGHLHAGGGLAVRAGDNALELARRGIGTADVTLSQPQHHVGVAALG